MPRRLPMFLGLLCCLPVLQPNDVAAQSRTGEVRPETSRGDALLAEYFRDRTRRITDNCLADIRTLADWEARREEYHRQLSEMLGLYPWPERTPLNVQVSGTIEDDAVIVEKLTFESMPGLYVTGNLYRPKEQTGKLPAVLYVCGHGRVVKDGISFGNKATYQHHGAWFARNGYVCLIIDTIQLGEIEGIHHGTYRYGMWWWKNRGYTSAGVEAWNGIRAVDYLQSREDVDPERIGITGRSGGGAYSWWVAALDDRIKVAVPVAGITSMHNHVVDGCIEGHCDCMYMVNTYAWDFPLVAALVAPRPLLVSNTDKDRIFPLDGVVDVYVKSRRIYDLYGKGDQIGLNICEGPHKDTQQLRINAFQWMNRFLKGDDPPIDLYTGDRFEAEDLKVFARLPEDERVTTIQESFVPAANPALPTSTAELDALTEKTLRHLKEKCFRNWPTDEEAGELNLQPMGSYAHGDMRVRLFEFTAENPCRLPLIVVDGGADHVRTAREIHVTVLDQQQWDHVSSRLKTAFSDWPYSQPLKDVSGWWWGPEAIHAYIVPRGIGPTEWNRDERKRVQIRRRFALLGMTEDSMRVYDTLRGLQAVNAAVETGKRRVTLSGSREAAGWTLHAALLAPSVRYVTLNQPSTDYRDGPYFLNVSRELTLPGTLLVAAGKLDELSISGWDESTSPRQSLLDTAKRLGWTGKRFTISSTGNP